MVKIKEFIKTEVDLIISVILVITAIVLIYSNQEIILDRLWVIGESIGGL
jgi:hypothetical protein